MYYLLFYDVLNINIQLEPYKTVTVCNRYALLLKPESYMGTFDLYFHINYYQWLFLIWNIFFVETIWITEFLAEHYFKHRNNAAWIMVKSHSVLLYIKTVLRAKWFDIRLFIILNTVNSVTQCTQFSFFWVHYRPLLFHSENLYLFNSYSI